MDLDMVQCCASSESEGNPCPSQGKEVAEHADCTPWVVLDSNQHWKFSRMLNSLATLQERLSLKPSFLQQLQFIFPVASCLNHQTQLRWSLQVLLNTERITVQLHTHTHTKSCDHKHPYSPIGQNIFVYFLACSKKISIWPFKF